jgi:hypothetical protein
MGGNPEIIKALGETCLSSKYLPEAIAYQRHEIMGLLFPKTGSTQGQYLLHEACEVGNIRAIIFLLDRRWTLIWIATELDRYMLQFKERDLPPPEFFYRIPRSSSMLRMLLERLP